jgi:ribonuclease HII
MILGIDEVGRGPWAGPLVAGAVVLGDGVLIEGLTDSKKLTAKRRQLLAAEIKQRAQAIGLGWVDASELDKLGISRSLVEATKRAIDQIKVPYHEIIIDGTVNFLAGTGKGRYVTTLKKADLLISSVSAASVIAKVARDEYMAEQARLYPEYSFDLHAGYGTAKHRAAIEEYGVTPLHRLSFAPLAKYRIDTFELSAKSPSLTSKQIGDNAETSAVEHLVRLGHKILDRNWKTRYCEIDIVSQKADTIYFTEVKYRKNDQQGGGLVAITARKLKQMRYAADFYRHVAKVTNLNARLIVVSVGGQPPMVRDVVLID